MNKDHNVNIPLVVIPPVNPIENEQGNNINLPKVDLAPLTSSAQDEKDEKYIVPLDGKWINSTDPLLIGKNFRTYKNLRYAKGHPEGILGMTKINTSVMNATYFKPRSAFHFVKNQPAENHILVQAFSAGSTGAILGSASQVLQNTTTVPNAGDFPATALWTDSSGAGIGSFSDAPNGQVAYCNGVDTCIWGGSELRVGAFITSTAAIDASGNVTDSKDVTDRMQNTKTDGDNLAYIGGGYDSYVKFLWHCDGADADTANQTAATGQTISLKGNACLDTAYKKFGTASAYFDGTGDYATVPDSTDWYFAAGDFTIDCWLKGNANSYIPIAGQYVDANNYWYYNVRRPSGNFYEAFFRIVSGGSVKADYRTGSYNLGTDFAHFELSRSGANVYFFANGSAMSTNTITAISTNEVPNLASALYIGASTDSSGTAATSRVMNGWIDEVRISKGIARHTDNFSVQTSPYLPNANYFLVGSPRPLQGIKLYIQTANSVASTLTGSTWNGSSWESLTLTDNTDTGASLAQTGTVTFSSTVNTSKPSYIEGYYLYWYQFNLSAGEASIYRATLDAPFQNIIDLWDGVYRSVACAYKMGATARTSISTQVFEDDYDKDVSETYAGLGSLDAYPTSMLEFGFTEKQTGLHFRLPDAYVNTAVGTTMSVDYWNGTQYVTVGEIRDGTSEDSISFAKSGTVVWNNSDISDESKTNTLQSMSIYSPLSDPSTTESIWGWYDVDARYQSVPLYYYRVRFDTQFSAAVRLNYVGGIASPKTMSGYSFALLAADRLMLGCDNYGYKNALDISAYGQPQVFNGGDSYNVKFGDEKPLTCGTSIFAQYASNRYNMALIFKASETWSLVWQQNTDTMSWVRFKISPNIGCPSPLTLKTMSAGFEKNINATKVIAIWRAEDGIYVSDGQSPLKVSDDIDSVFDQSNSLHVCMDMIPYESGYVDHHKSEYHWLWATDLYAITFTNGAHEVVEGDTITGNTSSATGIVDHVYLASGTWAGTAAGTIYMRSITGTWQNAETIKEGTTTVATSSSSASKAAYTYNSLDKEYVLDMRTWQWFEIDRGTGKRLQLGTELTDTSGNRYSYGFVDTGYVERLEYGTSFDGNDITHTLETGDLALIQGDVFQKTSISRANLVALPRNTDSTVTMTHFKDGALTGTDYTLSVANTTHRFVNLITDMFTTPAVFHSLKLVSTTDDEIKGFIPVNLAVYFKRERDRVA